MASAGTAMREVVVENTLGVHARPATMLAKKAKEFEANIYIDFGSDTADLASMMSTLMLAATKDSRLVIRAEGAEAEAAVDAIAALFAAKFDEE